MPIRVIVAAEHLLYLDAFKTLLEKDPDFCVVGLGGARGEAVTLVDREKPDAAIVVGDCDCDGAVALVEAVAVAARVVVAGCRGAPEASRAFAAGARGVVGAMQAPAELFGAVRVVAAGGNYVPSWPASAPAGRATPSTDPLARLSPRERQVFERLIEGESNAEIGRRLGISAKTVDTHRSHVMRKMGVHSVVQLVRLAARHQLLPGHAVARSAIA